MDRIMVVAASPGPDHFAVAEPQDPFGAEKAQTDRKTCSNEPSPSLSFPVTMSLGSSKDFKDVGLAQSAMAKEEVGRAGLVSRS